MEEPVIVPGELAITLGCALLVERLAVAHHPFAKRNWQQGQSEKKDGDRSAAADGLETQARAPRDGCANSVPYLRRRKTSRPATPRTQRGIVEGSGMGGDSENDCRPSRFGGGVTPPPKGGLR